MDKQPNDKLIFTVEKARILKELTEKYLHLIPKEEKPVTDKKGA